MYGTVVSADAVVGDKDQSSEFKKEMSFYPRTKTTYCMFTSKSLDFFLTLVSIPVK